MFASMVFVGAAVATEALPVPTPHPTSPIAVAALGGVDVLGSDHRYGWFGFVPGLRMRAEVSWGQPRGRGAVALSLTDRFLNAPESWVRQVLGVGLTAQYDPVVGGAAWELRLPIEAGLGWTNGMGLPDLRAGVALRARRARGPVHALLEVRVNGALGGSQVNNCLGCDSLAFTATAWWAGVSAGIER